MRLIDADELIEHAWRDKLDSRELIAKMIDNAPTVKEIPTKIPIDVFEQLISQEPKKGHWIPTYGNVKCSVCGSVKDSREVGKATHYCDFCGARIVEPQESEE